jgi:hypothetical protein
MARRAAHKRMSILTLYHTCRTKLVWNLQLAPTPLAPLGGHPLVFGLAPHLPSRRSVGAPGRRLGLRTEKIVVPRRAVIGHVIPNTSPYLGIFDISFKKHSSMSQTNKPIKTPKNILLCRKPTKLKYPTEIYIHTLVPNRLRRIRLVTYNIP